MALDTDRPETIESLSLVQDGLEVNVECHLKEGFDELEQKYKLGFSWSEGSQWQKLQAIRHHLTGMVLSTGCTIGSNADRNCLDIKVCSRKHLSTSI
jgi:hypothetical protein